MVYRGVRLASSRFRRGEPISQIQIGDRCQIKEGCRIAARSGTIRIGDRCAIGERAEIESWKSAVEIGNCVRIAAEVYILTSNHAFDDRSKPILDQGFNFEPVTIEDDVWIGRRAVILPGVTVGRGAVIGAGAVVTKDVPMNAIVAGVPARVIRTRDENRRIVPSSESSNGIDADD